MKIKSLYVCVNDMKRAINFYTNFFEVKPVKEDNVYSIFDSIFDITFYILV